MKSIFILLFLVPILTVNLVEAGNSAAPKCPDDTDAIEREFSLSFFDLVFDK